MHQNTMIMIILRAVQSGQMAEVYAGVQHRVLHFSRVVCFCVLRCSKSTDGELTL